MIELVLDYVSVNAYLAIKPAISLANDLDVELKLTPLRTQSELDFHFEPKPNETVGERHRRTRAAYTRMDAKRYADVQHLPFEIDGKDVDSTMALKGQLQANDSGIGCKYALEIFRMHWSGNGRLDAADDVEGVLSGLACDGFNEKEFDQRLNDVRSDAMERGIFAVPMFVVEGEKYLGRQHLPMIKWQLSGYQGPGPL